MKSIVVAYEKNRIIGGENALPWQRDLPADLRHFRELTLGNTIIMGRKTFESIGRTLPERQNIVISRMAKIATAHVKVVRSLEEAFAAAEHEPFVVGGGEIYRQALPYVDRIYATEIDAALDGDVTFPVLDESWHEIEREKHQRDERNLYDYDFVTYQKLP